MKNFIDSGIEHKTFTSFYTATIIEYIGDSALNELVVKRILGAIFIGLKSSLKDFRLATYMIVIQLASRIPMSAVAMDTVTLSIASNINDSDIEEAITCLVYLYQSQPVTQMKVDTFQKLVEARYRICLFFHFYPIFSLLLTITFSRPIFRAFF